MSNNPPDAVVVGSGPNGLAAAITIARSGRTVQLIEASDRVGGGCRSAALTLPGYVHDVCAAVHPMGVFSPFMRTLGLERHGLRWIHPSIPLAHPFDDGTAALLHRSLDLTANALGADGRAYSGLFAPFLKHWQALATDLLAPPLRVPGNPILMARFGLHALRSARGLALGTFRTEHARALFAGIAAHANLPLDAPLGASIGLMLGLAGHAVGWPIAEGGSQSIVNALAAEFGMLGGTTVLDRTIGSIDEVPEAKAVLWDLVPRHIAVILGSRIADSHRQRLLTFRHGPGVFKVDYALDAPVPWRSAECRQAGTLHLGGTLDEVCESESQVAAGKHPERPFVITSQPSVFDPTRAPAGKHTLWAYCHVPSGSTVDMSGRISMQIERFAPGFMARILSRSVLFPADLERYNLSYIGGDIAGGALGGGQLLFRPALKLNPYRLSARGHYICSSSTPPGPGVHGMSGHLAAMSAMGRELR